MCFFANPLCARAPSEELREVRILTKKEEIPAHLFIDGEFQKLLAKYIPTIACMHALLDELLAPDYVEHTMQLKGLESLKQYMTVFWKGFPDLHATIEDIIAEGDKVWIRVKVTGTHIGEYRGLAPTGKKITLTGVDICRIVDGKVVEAESVNDFLDFFKQLGVIEYKGFPDENP